MPAVTDSQASSPGQPGADLLEARDQVVRLRRLLEVETARGNRLSRHLAESTERQGELEASLEASRAETPAVTSDLLRARDELEQARGECDRLEAENAALRSELEAAAARVGSLESLLTELRAEVDGLRGTRALRLATRVRSVGRPGRRA